MCHCGSRVRSGRCCARQHWDAGDAAPPSLNESYRPLRPSVRATECVLARTSLTLFGVLVTTAGPYRPRFLSFFFQNKTGLLPSTFLYIPFYSIVQNIGKKIVRTLVYHIWCFLLWYIYIHNFNLDSQAKSETIWLQYIHDAILERSHSIRSHPALLSDKCSFCSSYQSIDFVSYVRFRCYLPHYFGSFTIFHNSETIKFQVFMLERKLISIKSSALKSALDFLIFLTSLVDVAV